MAQAYRTATGYIPSAGSFFERLIGAELPAAVRDPLHGTLTVLLEDDDDVVTPDMASFMAFISYLDQHRDVSAPSVGVNRSGLFVAVWQDRDYRLSLEFQTAGNVSWAYTDKHGPLSVRDGKATVAAAPSPPTRMRQAAMA